jgi:hypothetical protein
MKTILIVLLTFFTLLDTNGQIHIKNQKFIEFGMGGFDSYLPKSQTASAFVAIGKYNKKLNVHSYGFAFNQKVVHLFDTKNGTIISPVVPINQYYLYYKTDIKIYSNVTNNFIVKGLARINSGYESLNKEENLISDYLISKKSTFLLGVGVGAEIEYSPFLVGFQQNINLLSDYQKFNTIPYIGVRLHLH